MAEHRGPRTRPVPGIALAVCCAALLAPGCSEKDGPGFSEVATSGDLFTHVPSPGPDIPDVYSFISPAGHPFETYYFPILYVDLDTELDGPATCGEVRWRLFGQDWEDGGVQTFTVLPGRRRHHIDLSHNPDWNGRVLQFAVMIIPVPAQMRSAACRNVQFVPMTWGRMFRAAWQRLLHGPGRISLVLPYAIALLGVLLIAVGAKWLKRPEVFVTLWRHLPFLLLFLLFYREGLFYLQRYGAWELSNDEFQTFEHALRLVTHGEFVPNLSIDPIILPGMPRGVCFVWLTALSLWSFGINEMAGRLPSLVAGALSTVLLYVIVYRTTMRRAIAFLTALLLLLTPLFIQWHFASRFYTLVLLFHTLVLILFYLGLERSPRWCLPIAGTASCDPVDPAPARRRFERVRRYLCKERMDPFLLALSAVFFYLNLNQFLALGLVPFGLGAYGFVMFLLNGLALAARRAGRGPLALRESRLAKVLYHKYLALSCLFGLIVVVAICAAARDGQNFSTGILFLDRLPELIRANFDLTFSERNTTYVTANLPGRLPFLLVVLIGLGVLGFRRFGRRHASFGLFLFVNLAVLLPIVVYTWRTITSRYFLFMAAMYVPLLACGIFTAAYYTGAAWAWATRGPVQRFLAAWPRVRAPSSRVFVQVLTVMLLCALFHGQEVYSHTYVQKAFWKPFGLVEYRQAYDYLYAHIEPGAAVGFQYKRHYYAELMRERHHINMADYEEFSLLNVRRYTLDRMLEVIGDHRRGWLVWARNKRQHIDPRIILLCEKYMSRHTPTAHDTVIVYSWDATQAERIMAEDARGILLVQLEEATL